MQNLSQSDLDTIVDDLLVINDQKSKNLRYNTFILWSDITHILENEQAPQTEPFLRILGKKYYDSYPYAVEALLRKLTTPAQMHAFLEGLRQNQGPVKGRWHGDRYALTMVDTVLKKPNGVSPSCIPALETMRGELQRSVEALPPSEYPDLLDLKAIHAQERELTTPKNRVTWDHICKIYDRNLGVTKFSAIANGSGVCVGAQATDGLFLKISLLNVVRNLDLSKTEIFDQLTRLLTSPLKSPLDLRGRDADIFQLLDRSFHSICDKLTAEDKEVICKELEKLLLKNIFEWAFESTMGTGIDDRKEGWFTSWLEDRQHGNSLSLDVFPVNIHQTKKIR